MKILVKFLFAPTYNNMEVLLIPILIAVSYSCLMYCFSIWLTKHELCERSSELTDLHLKRITDRMAAALDLPKVRVFIYEIESVNGFAMTDGRILITRGFYQKYENGEVSDTELASVIAHELGHIALGHCRRKLFTVSGQNVLRITLAMMFDRFIPFFSETMANIFTNLIAARMSRSDEYEADTYAAALMTKAGLGVGPQISLFEKLEELTQSNAGAMPAWFMSHPTAHKRIAAIKALDARWSDQSVDV